MVRERARLNLDFLFVSFVVRTYVARVGEGSVRQGWVLCLSSIVRMSVVRGVVEGE